MKIVKILGIIVLALIIIAIIGNKTGAFGGPKGISITTDSVMQRDIVETVTASGKIYPVYEVVISAEISGEIVDLNVKEGQQIQGGELLMRINPDLYESQVQQAEASVNNAKANLSTARSRVLQTKQQLDNQKLAFDRSKQLHDQKVISQSDFEQAELAYQTAQAEYQIAQETVTAGEYTIKSAEAGLNEMRNNFKRTSIYAPIGGTVFGLTKKKGEKVLGTIQMSGDELMHIADLNTMEVQVDVSENDVLRINLGDSALIEVDAYNDRKFHGTVTQIANSAGSSSLLSAASQATNFKVKILLEKNSYKDLIPADSTDEKYPFYPGMSATAEIKTNTAKNVITVPIQAVTTREDSIKTSADKSVKELVFVINGDQVKETEIKTGIQDDNYIQVLEGLTVGQKIASGPYNTITTVLKDGDNIKEMPKKGADTKK